MRTAVVGLVRSAIQINSAARRLSCEKARQRCCFINGALSDAPAPSWLICAARKCHAPLRFQFCRAPVDFCKAGAALARRVYQLSATRNKAYRPAHETRSISLSLPLSWGVTARRASIRARCLLFSTCDSSISRRRAFFDAAASPLAKDNPSLAESSGTPSRASRAVDSHTSQKQCCASSPSPSSQLQ